MHEFSGSIQFFVYFYINKKIKSGSYLLSRDERSTIGVRGLDFRVRDGNGYGTSAMATGPEDPPGAPRTIRAPANRPILADRRTGPTRQYGQASRLISTGRLHVLPRLDLRPIDQVFSLVPSVSSWTGDVSSRGGLPA